MDDDVLQALVGGAPTDPQKQAALIAALRGQSQAGTLAQLTGDSVLAPFGKQLTAQTTQQAENIGTARQRAEQLTETQAQLAQQGRYQEAEIANQKAQREHDDTVLQETIRQHNLEDKQKQWQYGINPDGTTDTHYQNLKNAIMSYDAPPLNASASRNPRNANLMEEVYAEYAAAHPGQQFDVTGYQSKQQTMNDYAKGKPAALIQSVNAGIPHMDSLDTAIDEMQSSRFPTLNKYLIAAKKELGIATPQIDFDSMKKIVAAEVTKFIQGGGTGAGALADRQALEGDLALAQNPASLHSVLDKWRGLMGDQVRALEQRYKAGTFGRDDFAQRFLEPGVRQKFGYENPDNDQGTPAPAGKNAPSTGSGKFKGFSATPVTVGDEEENPDDNAPAVVKR